MTKLETLWTNYIPNIQLLFPNPTQNKELIVVVEPLWVTRSVNKNYNYNRFYDKTI